ncbi:large ribosomal subunit protein uL11 isoform X1 [Natator depressus]|uniref:large ribosomal subunit protein uL11 isoform X1 n=1 Tax=Natator depressus TaxID=27790 RepID=UPI003EB8C777
MPELQTLIMFLSQVSGRTSRHAADQAKLHLRCASGGRASRDLKALTSPEPATQPRGVFLRCTGGEVGATSALAPKIGPLGLSPKKVGDDIAKATGDWKGLRITVKLTIQNRQAQIEVVPSASALIIKALKEPPRDRKKQKNIKHSGSVSFDEIVNIARQMRHRSLARELSGTIKEILGTAQSVGCNIDGRHPHDVIDDISSGTIECPAS